MRRLLPIHPLSMKTTFRRCFLVNFAVEPERMRARLPPHLEPDVYGGRAYLSIVIAEMLRMRPAFLPPLAGITYNQVVYRAVVRCGTERGVTFLRSDADNRLMVAAGNALTFFRFHPATMGWQADPGRTAFHLHSRWAASIAAEYDTMSRVTSLPSSSGFPDLETAGTFLTELYTAFGARRSDGRIEVVRIRRSPWRSHVIVHHSGSYEAMSSGLLFSSQEAQLDSVFQVTDLAYHWNSLSLERIPATGSAH